MLRSLDHQRLPVWGVNCPLKWILSTIKCHTRVRLNARRTEPAGHCVGGGFDRSAGSRRLSHSVCCLPPQIDAERSPEEVLAQICQVMETFWFVQSPPRPRGPWMKFPFLSSSYFLLTDAHPTRRPHTHSCQTFHSLSSRGVHAPRTSPLLSLQRRRREKHSFSTDKAPLLPHSASSSCSLSFSFLTLTSTNADNCWTEAQFCTEENYTPCCDWEHVSSGVWKKKTFRQAEAPREEEKWIRQREPLMLSCTALCFVLYQACKSYNQASTPFGHWNLEWNIIWVWLNLNYQWNAQKMHLYVLRLIVQVLVGVWYLTFNKASAFAKQWFPSVWFGFCGRDATCNSTAPSAGKWMEEKKRSSNFATS